MFESISMRPGFIWGCLFALGCAARLRLLDLFKTKQQLIFRQLLGSSTVVCPGPP
jgi:hypothetical protein